MHLAAGKEFHQEWLMDGKNILMEESWQISGIVNYNVSSTSVFFCPNTVRAKYGLLLLIITSLAKNIYIYIYIGIMGK